MPDAAGTLQTGPEIANVLGRLQVEKPFIAARVTSVVEYARIVKYVLAAIDGYMDRSGKDLATIARDIRHGRIEVRCIGNRIVVVVP
jgi:hypothetical protein